MIALLLATAAFAADPPKLSAELRSLLSYRADPGPLSAEQARLLARPQVRIVIAADDGFDLGALGPGADRSAPGARPT